MVAARASDVAKALRPEYFVTEINAQTGFGHPVFVSNEWDDMAVVIQLVDALTICTAQPDAGDRAERLLVNRTRTFMAMTMPTGPPAWFCLMVSLWAVRLLRLDGAKIGPLNFEIGLVVEDRGMARVGDEVRAIRALR